MKAIVKTRLMGSGLMSAVVIENDFGTHVTGFGWSGKDANHDTCEETALTRALERYQRDIDDAYRELDKIQKRIDRLHDIREAMHHPEYRKEG